ncbi:MULTISPECIES: hypothetical protein [Paenibacillus]|jgi:chromosome segregation ATPase|uniref:Uncharacterized protein n=1 Tax=Paenibacillus odorifer TaxID=189426 RepID=A0ABX3HVR7_9BACL|nr:hypothetical protein [Paenibacillus odorifer]OMD54101.1 hypothetical protein BSK51_07915 [Paenibacillus odorifer]
MSESGKIPLSSMTPERIEEIKRNFKAGSPWWFMIEKAEIAYLIHSLEESQQQNARWKEAVNGLMMADTDVQRDLAEAQQTIARQQAELDEYQGQMKILTEWANAEEMNVSDLISERNDLQEALEKIKSAAPNPFYHMASDALK